ncbi:MAG: sce7725 family protein [Chlorobiaceae bacterium]|nr:sce7725 family protein [Chlorobiaceae bacterium]
MYYPYLRGKQFELLALRDLIVLLSENNTKVSPIIEPVKTSSTLIKTLEALCINNINFNIIINPFHGELINKTDQLLYLLKEEISEFENYQLSILVDNRDNVKKVLDLIALHKSKCKGITLIHNSVMQNVNEVISLCEEQMPVINNVINFENTSANRRYYRSFIPSTRVSLSDYFKSQSKNSNYLSIEESQFTDEHLFYKEEGYKGFGDFLTIGDNYSESGFLPYAVAIHISYADSDNNVFVKHFVSDSNDDASDVGGKFAEANAKLVDWCKSKGLSTIGIKSFYELYESGHFPGLGTIKKYSIMNHIELMLKLI